MYDKFCETKNMNLRVTCFFFVLPGGLLASIKKNTTEDLTTACCIAVGFIIWTRTASLLLACSDIAANYLLLIRFVHLRHHGVL